MDLNKTISHSIADQKSGLANATWLPRKKDRIALDAHSFVRGIDRVDQMWPWLKKHYGEVLAVNAPHCNPPDRFNYGELADKISIAASAFKSLGVVSEDVVALFSENSPRWLILDQGLMRLGASDAVRGATAPVEELKYILNDSRSIGLIVQSAQLWNDLALSDEQKKQLKFVLQIEGEPIDDLIGWEDFLRRAENDNPIDTLIPLAKGGKTPSIATILYTSGTTGRPKGVPLTHENLMHQIRSLACVASPPPRDTFIECLTYLAFL